MNDAALVCRCNPASHLDGPVECGGERYRPPSETLAQGLALQKFGHHVGAALVNTDVMNCQDVGMIQ